MVTTRSISDRKMPRLRGVLLVVEPQSPLTTTIDDDGRVQFLQRHAVAHARKIQDRAGTLRYPLRCWKLAGSILAAFAIAMVFRLLSSTPYCISEQGRLCIPPPCKLYSNILPSLHTTNKQTASTSCPLHWTNFPSPSLTLSLPRPAFESSIAPFHWHLNPLFSSASLPFNRSQILSARHAAIRCWHPDHAKTHHISAELASVIARRIEVAYHYVDVRLMCLTNETVTSKFGTPIHDLPARDAHCAILFAKTSGQLARTVQDESGTTLSTPADTTNGIVPKEQNAAAPWPLSWLQSCIPHARPIPVSIFDLQYPSPHNQLCAHQSPISKTTRAVKTALHGVVALPSRIVRAYGRRVALKVAYQGWAGDAKVKAEQDGPGDHGGDIAGRKTAHMRATQQAAQDVLDGKVDRSV